ncbi:glycosyl transferase, group 1 [Aquipluma nitroreducens]|uniref:Glycosyl transferase, group 1 n=1 Tax=Aquipluma nitroreducens TaxID=2010828 RepID=A0A5K7SCG2_9BACT|nr:glycosyltransferase [Aquipluma nitroreducens]BBE19260.1 glycosyl transferase, group 1 [Aquipluma nitroreducens]
MKRIKIIGPAYPYRGGIATFNERLAQEFASMGIDIDIETFIIQYPSFLFPGKTQYNDKPAPENRNIKRTINSINPLNWIKVGRRIRKEAPDLVIIRYWLPVLAPCLGTIVSLARRNKHTVIICLADNIIPHEHRSGDRLLTNYFMQRIDGLIAMSQSVLKDGNSFRKNLPQGFCPHPIFDNYGEKLSFEIAKQKLKLDPNTRYLLFFGFIRDYKGLDLLINAFADERLRKFPVKLLVAGEYYSSPEPYLKLIRDNNLENLIELRTDFIPDDQVNLYFSAADMVVQPYKSATQSGVTQIGYHFNKPMLVTNVGGLAEIIPDEKIGYVVEPEIREIAGALIDFYENDRIAEFEANIVEEKKKFSWANMANTFLSVYNKIKNPE